MLNQRSARGVLGLRVGAVVLSLGLSLAISTLEAQTGTGNITGFVRDTTGAVIPGATVTSKMVEQQAVRGTVSDGEGAYRLLALPPGTYEITYEASGFQRLIRTDLELSPNQNLRVDATLEVGTVETEVTVTSAAPLVETTAHTVSGVIDDRRVVDLPINGRNVIGLARILPGVLSVIAPQQLSDARSGPRMNVNGGRRNMNQFTFNGGYFNNPSRNTGMNFPPPDAVQEVSLLTHNFPAQYGRNPGAQVSVVSKAGTNEFHGSAWEFLRNDNLNARSFFDPRVPHLVQNQYGVAAGGPIVKNKLFAFASYQGLEDRGEASTVQAFVPSAAERSGDFRGADVTLMNPTDVLTGQPFTDAGGNPCVVGNVIAPSCISPVAQNFLDFIPQSPSGTIVSLASSPRAGDMFLTRVDLNITDNHRLYGHYFFDDNSRNQAIARGEIPNYIGQNLEQETNQVVINDTYTFSPTLLNELTFSVIDTGSDQLQTRTIAPSELGIRNMPQYVPTGAIHVNVSGRFTAGSGFTTRFFNRSYQFKDSLNWIKGKHNFKFGYEILDLQFRQRFIGSPNVSFNGARTGDPMADFMLGAFDSLGVDFGVRDTDVSTVAHAAYFQDEYRVRPGFTLTYGIRYEPFLPWVEKNDRINTIVPGRQSTVVPDAPPGFLFPGDLPRGLADHDLNNFGPRFGFAWDVFGNGSTSVRGGYGLFFESINGDSLAQENAPFAGGNSVFSGRWEDPWGSVGRTPPPAETSGQFGCVEIQTFPGLACELFPLPIGPGVYTGLDLRTPYVQSFNFSLQHQLTETTMVEASYIGKIGIKIEALRPLNPARFINSPIDGSPPSDQNISHRVIFQPGILGPEAWILGNDFRSWYHSFQGQVTKRFAKGWTVVSSYTLSKSIDSSSTDNLGATVSNPFDLRTEQGRSSWDRRHAFVASWLWNPPVRFSGRLANALLGGWTLTGIHSLQSGLPLTFEMGDDVALDGTFGDYRAQLAPGVTHEDIQIDHSSRGAMIERFFNTGAFVPTNDVPRGTYGNAGRGLISGPALASSDFAILKDFAFNEDLRLQFRTELFNAFNQVNFTNVNTTVASGTFGRIRRAGEGRVIQFALKVLW